MVESPEIVSDSLVYYTPTRISARESLRTRGAVPLDSIADIEYRKTDAGRTALLIGGVVVGAFAVFVAAVAIYCSSTECT